MNSVYQNYQAFDRLCKDIAYFKKNEPTFEVTQGSLPAQWGGSGNAIMLRGKIDGIEMAFYVPYDYPERQPLCVIYNQQGMSSDAGGTVESVAVNGMEWFRVHTILTKVAYVRDYVRKAAKTRSGAALYNRSAGLQLTMLQDTELLQSGAAVENKLNLTDFQPKVLDFNQLYESITQKDKAEESVPSTPSPATKPYPQPLYTPVYNEQTPKSLAFPAPPFIPLNVKSGSQKPYTSQTAFSYYLRRCRHLVGASEAYIEKYWQKNRDLYYQSRDQAVVVAGEISAMLQVRYQRITSVPVDSDASAVLSSLAEKNREAYEYSNSCGAVQASDLFLKRIMYSSAEIGEIQYLLAIDDFEARISYLAR